MSQTPPTGPRASKPGPGGQFSPEELRRLRLRSDRTMGIGLFALGIFGTIMHMTSVGEQALVSQVVVLFDQFGLGAYHRPSGLAAISWTGIVLHVVNYAVWLYVAVRRWQAQKFALWCAGVGAVCALVITLVVVTMALFAHPEIIDWLVAGGELPGASTTPNPTMTPTPTP